jgi:hypothetical protein
VQRTGDGQAQVGYSVAGRSGGRVTLCAVCTVHKGTRSMSFLVEPQNQGCGFPGLGLKTDGYGLVIWSTKSPQQFLGLGLKIKWEEVCHLRLKTMSRSRRCEDTRRYPVACFIMILHLTPFELRFGCKPSISHLRPLITSALS